MRGPDRTHLASCKRRYGKSRLQSVIITNFLHQMEFYHIINALIFFLMDLRFNLIYSRAFIFGIKFFTKGQSRDQPPGSGARDTFNENQLLTLPNPY